jgi:hypothetical protein
MFDALCGTILCYVVNPLNNKKIKVRALLDSGANATILERDTARKINLTGRKVPLHLKVAGGKTVTSDAFETAFQLESLDGSRTREIGGWINETVTAPFSPVSLDPKDYDHLRGIEFADTFPNPNERPVQLILGEPYFSIIQVDNCIRGHRDDYPVAQETRLGWVLRGALGITSRAQSALCYSTLAFSEEEFDLGTVYESLAFDFKKFWDGENVGIKPREIMHSEHTALEIKALEFHRQTARFDPVLKRWSVRLPWIHEDIEEHRMSDNTARAVAFFHKFWSKVKPEHEEHVRKAYEELIDQGFAEPVPEDEIHPEWPTYVMTSRTVIRLDRETTKARVIINASLIDPRDKSKALNKLLMPGPNLLPQIMELIMKLMQKEFIFMIDVKKMFLAVKLELKSDKDMLRYLYGPKGSQPKLYRLTSLGFGILSSPFQAMQCLRGTAEALKDKYPEAAESIHDNTYMDDNSDGRSDIASTAKLLNEILHVMESGGFHGHKIAASHPQITADLDPSRLNPSRIVSVLGLKLDFDTNEFMFDLDEKFKDFKPDAPKITRRDMVAVAARVFDTQGFVSPFIMQYKTILPMMWANDTKWDDNLVGRKVKNTDGKLVDDPVALEAVALFKNWFEEVPKLKELRFTRFLPGKLETVAIFGDASKKGIGAVAYLVKRQDDGSLKSQIFYSKSSLMPKDLRKRNRRIFSPSHGQSSWASPFA